MRARSNSRPAAWSSWTSRAFRSAATGTSSTCAGGSFLRRCTRSSSSSKTRAGSRATARAVASALRRIDPPPAACRRRRAVAAALLLALILLDRVLATQNRLARPIFWVAAAYFPPLFADVSAGQRGGVMLGLAMASIWFERKRPALAGAVGGLAAAIKYYPAAMILGPRPAHRIRYALVLFGVLVLVTAATFIPLGAGGTLFYYQHVLLPSLASHNPDCAYDSVRTLFMRYIGGEQFAVPGGTGYVLVTSPLHLSALALFLSYASALVFAAAAACAAWRSAWDPAY